MTVSQYLDLAYSTLVDERVRRGSSLYDSLEATEEWAAGRQPMITVVAKAANTASGNTVEKADPGGPGAPLTPEELANAEAMTVFTAAMSNVGGGPG